MILIQNVTCVDGRKTLENMSVLINGTKIEKIFPASTPIIPNGVHEIIDGDGEYLVPGYIDLHVHGAMGEHFGKASAETIDRIVSFFAAHGTTSLLIGTGCDTPEETHATIEQSMISAKRHKGSNILGIHLEGPFISPARPGACYVPGMLKPDVKTYETIVGEYADFIRLVALAPELDDDLILTKHLVNQGICVSIGHSTATAEVVKRAIDVGIYHCTHFFNGMKPMHHRDPGIVGICLQDDRVNIELIGDLIHVDADIIKLAIKCKGIEHCILITDSTMGGLPDGAYDNVTIRNHQCLNSDGVISGSTLAMDQDVQNMVRIVGLSLQEAIRMASENPAKEIGFGNCKGAIREGYDADLNFLDAKLNVTKTMIMGKLLDRT